jgi:hypothetical protein
VVLQAVSAGLLGDYNGDSFVNAADYTVWRNNLGGDAGALAAGSRGPGITGPVSHDDYDFWKSQYGQPGAGAGSGQGGFGAATVPEPASGLIALSALIGGILARRFRRPRF